MGFLLGLLVGSSLSGGTPAPAPMLNNTIPLRCYAALDISDKAYRQCRMPSLWTELNNTGCPSWEQKGAADGDRCNINDHFAFELKALHELNAEALKGRDRAK